MPKMRKCLLMILVFITSLTALSQNYFNYYLSYIKADSLFRVKDYKISLEYYKRLHEGIPSNPIITYRLGYLYSLTADKKNAIRLLNRALDLGYNLNHRDEVFANLKGHTEFEGFQKKFNASKVPVNKSKTVFTIPDREFAPEGIIYDPVDKCFYLGSVYKCNIVKITESGEITNFKSGREDGLRTVLGMKVDAERRILWVNSCVTTPPPENVNMNEFGWSGVFKYDLKTGKLLKKYTLFKEGEKHLFNDIALNSRGDIFISDSEFGAVYTISQDKDRLELFLKSENFIYPNGITISPDETKIYLAAWSAGIFIIDIKSKEISVLSHPDNFTTYGIDGLYFYKNGFIAVQNSILRISRFYLNKKLNRVQRLEILEANNPDLDIPTTGVIVNDQFYYIANCPLRHYEPDGTLNLEGVKEVMINRIDLN